MNPLAEDIKGWIQEDAIGKNVDEVFKVVNELPTFSKDSKIVHQDHLAGQ